MEDGLKKESNGKGNTVGDYIHGFLKGLGAAACFGVGARIIVSVGFHEVLAFAWPNYLDALSLIMAGSLHLYEILRGDKHK